MSVEYVVDDALAVLEREPAESATLVHLDDAWARPNRNGAFGVEYPTHPFDEGNADAVAGEPGVETDVTVVDMLEACWRVLAPGGVLVCDADAWLYPNLLSYFAERLECGQLRDGGVTLLSSDGTPDRSTPGMYLSSGGYPVLVVAKGACPTGTTYVTADRQREDFGWGTVKPLAPSLHWVETFVRPGERVVVPCAGTAPTAIAAERVYGDDVDVLAVDVEPEAREAWQRRRAVELEYQSGLEAFARGESA